MKSKNSLQKFTEMESKISEMLSLDQITPNDTEDLNESEEQRLSDILTEKFNNLKGIERDKFLKKIEPILGESTKNELWEYNHSQITWAISILMQEKGRMPSKTDIAAKTELSRQTINKHFKYYSTHPEFLGQIEQFRFMTSKVLAKVFQFAVNGDMRAAKLYLTTFGSHNEHIPSNTLIQNQNNFIQINGTVISQEAVMYLNPDQLNIIETILKTVLPQIENFSNNKTTNEKGENNYQE